MIFKSKKEFENAVYERMSEIEFRSRTDERLYRLEEQVINLEHRIKCIEDRLTVPAPTPYIVNSTWTGTGPGKPYTSHDNSSQPSTDDVKE